MPKSTASRMSKVIEKTIFVDDESGDRYDLWGKDAPPYKVGKQFPYSNASESGKTFPHSAPHPKELGQLEIEAAYLGRNRHQLVGKTARHTHGGDGTIRRSSQRRSFRGEQVSAA